MADAPRLPLPQDAKVSRGALSGLSPAELQVLGDLKVPAGGLDAAVDRILGDQAAKPESHPANAPRVELDESKIRDVRDLSPAEAAAAREGLEALADVARSIPRTAPAPDAEGGLRDFAAQSRIPGMAAAMAAEPPATPPPPEPEPAAVDVGTVPIAKVCPRCSWDQRRLDVVEASPEDRLRWAAALYGSRFIKRYELLGGALILTFRALTTAELDAAYTQAARDSHADATLFLARTLEYQFYLCLEAVELPAQGRRLPVAHAEYARPGGTFDLPGLKAAVVADVLTTESLSKIANAKFHQFRRLVEWMEGAIDDPNFLEGIGGTI